MSETKSQIGKSQALQSPSEQTSASKPAGTPQPAPKLVSELKVSGHLMTLDAGLFCIFNAPGSAAPDQASGLPGVRISLPPGPMFRPDAVTITSFREDGWLGGWNGAALVRVTRGPAQVLVTIYQAPNTNADAPRLQVLRLTDSANLPASAPATGMPPAIMAQPASMPVALAGAPRPAVAPPAKPAVPPAASMPQNTPASAATAGEDAKSAEMIAHIQGRGDVLAKLGEWMGEPGSQRWVEGFALAPRGKLGPADIEYQAVLGRGWLSPWAEGGQYCGSRSMSLPILGLRVRLRGEAAESYDCMVEASFVDGTKVGPLDNGEPCQAASLSPLESFRVKLMVREAMAPPSSAATGKAGAKLSRKSAPKAETKPAAKSAGPSRAPKKKT